jgi:outer membrane protein assembly factor BamD (BamD/ComL family)
MPINLSRLYRTPKRKYASLGWLNVEILGRIVMMRALVSTCFLSLLITLVGCASNPGNKKAEVADSKHLTPEQIQELNQQTMQKVSDRLKELSIAAKASGEDKVTYLASDMYLKASAALMEGDYHTANLIFERLVELVPKDTFVKRKYAVSLIRTGELDKSKVLLTELFEGSKFKDAKVGLILAGVIAAWEIQTQRRKRIRSY